MAKTKAKKQENRSQELENQLKRALADYQNLEKRVEEEKKLLSDLYSAIVIEKFLPVLDNLLQAQKHIKDEGLEMVVKQFKEILESEGVSEIETTGANFNPEEHEAVQTQEGKEDGQIVKVVAKGYKINDKVIRPAKVVVSKKEAVTQKEEIQDAQVHQEVN